MTDRTPPSGTPPRGLDGWSARPVVRVSTRHIWMAAASGAGLLVFGVLLVVLLLPSLLTTNEGEAEPSPPASPESARRIQATLFFVSEDGGELLPVSVQVPYGATPLEQARHIVDAAVAAPPAGQRSAIPEGTTVRSVFLADGRAYVDLGGPVVSGHSGGTLNEALTVYAIVNAVTVNLPDISAVQILVEGRQIDTLAGHLDLRYPVGKALEWVRKGQ